jgi:uncharacterized protein (TIGR02301 family)
VRRLVAAVAVLVLFAHLGPASAQTPPAKPPASKAVPTPAPKTNPTPAPEPPPPYDPQLLRLAELMGALSYLRDLCGEADGAKFHDEMAHLLDAEARTTERKEALAGAFNRGFDDYQLTYRACTPNAEDIIARYLEESARIARDVANRFGG